MIGPNLIYVHINRTGGTTTTDFFKGHGGGSDMPGRGLVDFRPMGHWTAHEMKVAMTYEEYNSKFRFTIVRNPWDRMVSHHIGIIQKVFKETRKIDRDEFNKYLIMTLNDPADWDEVLRERMHVDDERHCTYRGYWPCSRWYSGDFHYVGRYETLHNSLNEAFSLYEDFTGMKFAKREIKHLNNGNLWRDADYQYYYSDEARKLVADRFASDIDNFGYEF